MVRQLSQLPFLDSAPFDKRDANSYPHSAQVALTLELTEATACSLSARFQTRRAVSHGPRRVRQVCSVSE